MKAVPQLNVEIPTNDYWQRQIKCQYACPVHTDSRGYVRAIADGDFERAYLIARGPNPLASICGRICGAPCEAACRRTDLDSAVSIRALKRFVTERFGVEAPQHSNSPLNTIKRFLTMQPEECEGLEDIKNLLQHVSSPALSEDSPSVGIIGSGPAGLAAAHDLCLMGIKPVIYEMEPVAAGMLYLGVPEYRLPRDLITAEVEVIKALGATIHCNTTIGKDITLQELRSRHAAVLIAVGAKKSRSIPLRNIDAEGVYGGIELLRSVALNEDVSLGENVLVIGGGNVAYDVARTLVRQTGMDVSRTALRQLGVKKVHLVSLESIEEMPADDVEIQEGEEEGILRHNSWGPTEILVNQQGHVAGVQFQRCVSVFDANGRFAPKFDPTQILELPADNVFLTIGQASDLSFIDSDDVAVNERGQLQVDPLTQATQAQGVFAAGDVALGPRLMIDAIANGKQAAREIYRYIKQQPVETSLRLSHIPVTPYHREMGYESQHREGVPALSPEARKQSMSKTVEQGFNQEQSCRQAGRCFNCSVNTIFDSERCILCGGCADVCPESCLKLVSLNRLQGDADLAPLVETYLQNTDIEDASAIIKDETVCIRCGLCAERCPVNAITMETFQYKETLL
jgi:formate dehydrogenase (NADP+) beta subunit